MKLSIVVPMYNEEPNVDSFFKETLPVLKEHFEDWEIIVVDDGSTDRTAELVGKYADGIGIRLYAHDENRGMGAAIRTAFQHVTGDVIVTIEADLSDDPAEIVKLIDLYKKGFHIVLGSPYKEGGKVERADFWRILLSKITNRLYRIASGLNLSCFTSIFRAYSKELVSNIEIKFDGFEFQPHVVVQAHKRGFKIAEVPITLRTRKAGYSKSKILREISRHLKVILLILNVRLLG